MSDDVSTASAFRWLSWLKENGKHWDTHSLEDERMDDGIGCVHGVASCDRCDEAHSRKVRDLEAQLDRATAERDDVARIYSEGVTKLRAERDEALAQVAKLRRALEVATTHLPEDREEVRAALAATEPSP